MSISMFLYSEPKSIVIDRGKMVSDCQRVWNLGPFIQSLSPSIASIALLLVATAETGVIGFSTIGNCSGKDLLVKLGFHDFPISASLSTIALSKRPLLFGGQLMIKFVYNGSKRFR